MKSVFFREQQRYSQIEIIEQLGQNHSEAIKIIKRLKEYGVLKIVEANETQKNLTDLAEEDVEIVDVQDGESRYFYVFTYVGLLLIDDYVLKCYPKYIKSNTSPDEELKEVLRVIDKFNKREEVIHLYNESYDTSSFNKLALILAILRDYFEYGVYSVTEKHVEVNGNGNILWDKTVNESFAWICKNRPIYPEVFTRRITTDETNYFARLHETVVSLCSKELEGSDLLNLFDLTSVNLSEAKLDSFGDDEYIRKRVYKELSNQFNTRKQRVLKLIYAYIANHEKKINDVNCFSLFGVNKFHVIWEKICASILDDQLHNILSEIDLPVPIVSKYSKDAELIDIIEKPKWNSKDDKQVDFYIEASKTLIPDIVRVERNESISRFMIYDAKYYNLQLERGKQLLGQPGIESVTKQYLYQLAYRDFIADHNIDIVENCFLFPTEGSSVVDQGYVNLKMMDSLGLEHIKIRLVPARFVYQKYLSGQTISSSELLL